MVRISTIGVVLAVLVAAAVASVELERRVCARVRQARSASSRTRLRAMPTRKLIPAFQRHAGRTGHLVPAVLRRLRRAGARGDRRAQGRRRRVLARAGHDVARQGGSRRQVVEEEAVPRDRHALGRRLRRPQGQPEAHPHLERPDQARRRRPRAERPDLRRRQVGRDRRVRRAAQARQVARAVGQVPEQALRPRRLAGQERARGARRRSSPAAATSSSRTRTRRSSPRSTTSRSTT